MGFDFDFGNDSLKGRNILVAGGTGGLGSAAVALLARDGARVVVGFRSNRKRAEELQQTIRQRWKANIHLVEGDIRDPAVRKSYLDRADQEGGIYGLVCYTGDPARVDFNTAEASDLTLSMEENYFAPLLLARDAGARMTERKTKGAIVLISSMQAVAPFDGSFNYAGPKTALVQAGLILARQWGGPTDIRVNVVAPGVNRAGMAQASIESGKYDPFMEKGVIPRFGRPEDTARLVRLLLEPDNYITGQVITVDGGLTLRR